MKTLIPSVVATVLTVAVVHAELPSLEEDGLQGTFSTFDNREMRFQLFVDGGGVIYPLFKDKQVFPYVKIPLSITLAEVLPNGVIEEHAIDPASLETDDKPTSNMKTTTIRGKFEGGGAFEAAFEEKRGALLVSSKLTDDAGLAGKELRLQVTAEILNFYGRELQKLGGDMKAFEALAKKSSLAVLGKDRKKSEFDFTQIIPGVLTSTSEAFSQEAEVELDVIERSFKFAADGKSGLKIDPRRKEQALHYGCFIRWSPDDAKNPAGSVFTIEVD
ncbi:hypothetical protein [Haloferula helveola]